MSTQVFSPAEAATVWGCSDREAARRFDELDHDSYVYSTKDAEAHRGKRLISRHRAYAISGNFPDNVPTMEVPPALTIEDVADMFGCHPTTLGKLIEKYPERFITSRLGRETIMFREPVEALFGGPILIWPDVPKYVPAPADTLPKAADYIPRPSNDSFTEAERKVIGGITKQTIRLALNEFAKANGMDGISLDIGKHPDVIAIAEIAEEILYQSEYKGGAATVGDALRDILKLCGREPKGSPEDVRPSYTNGLKEAVPEGQRGTRHLSPLGVATMVAGGVIGLSPEMPEPQRPRPQVLIPGSGRFG